jgi:uncharacterized protein YndB with AHSA1/START domain
MDADTATDAQQVAITHVFDAPIGNVFRAWTDPDEVAAWYGPAGMRTPREKIQIDLRVGGRFELTMVSLDGDREYSIGYQIVELSPPELIVLRSDPMPEAGKDASTTVRIARGPRGPDAHDSHRRPAALRPRARRSGLPCGC